MSLPIPAATAHWQDWLTPLGAAPVDVAAVDFLSQVHRIPVNEAPHATEHSIENQLPFLVHAASWGWDLAAAGCMPPSSYSSIGGNQQQQQQAARLSIVPVSVGYLGQQPQQLIKQYGAAVAGLLQHLQSQQQHQQQQQQFSNQPAGSGTPSDTGGHEVVLIVSSDFTHAGPWYRELPPPGVSLEDYMTAQDTPVIQVGLAGSQPRVAVAENTIYLQQQYSCPEGIVRAPDPGGQLGLVNLSRVC